MLIATVPIVYKIVVSIVRVTSISVRSFLYMGTKISYKYKYLLYLDVNVVGYIEYIYVNYAYYKKFSTCFFIGYNCSLQICQI